MDLKILGEEEGHRVSLECPEGQLTLFSESLHFDSPRLRTASGLWSSLTGVVMKLGLPSQFLNPGCPKG